MERIRGGCACGLVRLFISGSPDRVGICHCIDCRKHHGALFYAAAVFAADAVTVMGETKSHEGRHFCPQCGSPVFARSDGEIEVHLGTLDKPGVYTPEYELWTSRREPWLPAFPVTERHARNRDGDDET